MTSDDQHFLDLLASVPGDIASYGSRIADYIDKHSDFLATELRDVIESATWFPDSMRPSVRSVAHNTISAPAASESFLAKTTTWISKNRTAVAAVVAFVGTTALLIHRRNKAYSKKRRARRDRNGRKNEIVVMACSSFRDPLSRSLALDLDRRGYIVYITVSSTEEDSLVLLESKRDIRPLWMDLSSPVPNPGLDVHLNLEPICRLIRPSSRSSSPGSDKSSQSTSTASHHTLAGLIILPGSVGSPAGPLAALPATDLVDSINTRLLAPILTVQQFIPLLSLAEKAARSETPTVTRSTARSICPSIILAYPSIPASLHPPYQIPETIITSSLSCFARSLRRELAGSSGISITELKLGLFDLGAAAPRARAGEYVYPHAGGAGGRTSRNSALTHWHSSQRAAAQRSLDRQQEQGDEGGNDRAGGSSLREFHNAVFDTLNPGLGLEAFGAAIPWARRGGRRGARTVYVGQGARLYDIVGKWVPEGLVGWLIRRQTHTPRGESFEGGGGGGGSVASGAEEKSNDLVEEEEQEERPTTKWGVSSASDNSESGVWEKL